MPTAMPVITPNDLAKFPVWTFDLANEGRGGHDETWMVPVEQIPVSSLSGCCCLANAKLACGREVMATLWSVDLESIRYNEQFMRVAFWLDEKWWHLSDRPFISKQGILESHRPSDLASKLRLSLEEIFPISYDIRKFACGPIEITNGHILVEPREKLTRRELDLLVRARMREACAARSAVVTSTSSSIAPKSPATP